MIIDAHAHYGPIRLRSFSDEQLIAALDRYGIAKALMSSPIALSGEDRRGNEALHRMQEKYPDRIVGYCVPNPFREPVEEIRRCADYGCRAIKLHPGISECPMDHRLYWPVYEEAQRRRMPVLFHTGGNLVEPDFRFATPEMAVQIARQFPGAVFIAGPMGLERWLEFIDAAPRVDNLYLDITMSVPGVEKVEMAVQAVGARRVVFGTDLPLLNPAIPLGLLEEARLTNEEKERILWQNINELI